ncbi:potassium-transporting ATPase subunit KdpC [Alicyclobacillaceae bacterium I2511]|nr:potassium-transporting ATPase subunit KdpC [Alicyclobacillaceae bacterium I2511]
MRNLLRSLRWLVASVVMLGLIYPLLITGIGQWVFPFQANGSMVQYQGQVVGSRLIAQQVTLAGLFYPRPSAVNYDANGSGGSNLGPTNPALIQEVKKNLEQVLHQNPGVTVAQVPTSMVESSGSGLDPDITVHDALLQVPRVAQATGLSVDTVQNLVRQNTRGRFLGLWGVGRVNVLDLNLAVLKAKTETAP